MAGNFWQSSHFTHWMLDKQDLYMKRKRDLSVLTEEEYGKIMILFANCESSLYDLDPGIYVIQILGENLKLKQQVIATATVYFKRYYSQNSFKCIDPFLMAPTCVLLASKVEEQGPVQTSKLQQVTANVLKTKCSYAYKQEYTYRPSQILECEFFLLEMMDCCLIVFQPYRPLTEFCEKLSIDNVLPLAWKIVNDSLRTDAALLYPPYLIALASMHVATVIMQKNCHEWFAELSVDFDKVREISQMIMSLYDLWKEGYDEKKEILPILEKMPKPKLSR